MIKQFGIFDSKSSYIDRNGAYLLYVNSDCKLPIVQSSNGYYLVGGGIEKYENAESCLRRESVEEIGAKLGVLHPICETKTFFSLNGKKYTSHNTFFLTDYCEICMNSHENLKLHWMTFTEAKACLTLEHQAWAISYFEEITDQISQNQ